MDHLDAKMNRIGLLLLLCNPLVYCSCSIGAGSGLMSSHQSRLYLEISPYGYGVFSGKWRIENNILTVIKSRNNYLGGPSTLVVFQRHLSDRQMQEIIDAVTMSGVINDMGQTVWPNVTDAAHLQPGHHLIRIQLAPGKPGSNPRFQVEYWDHLSKSARIIVSKLNQFVPSEYHFVKE